MPHIWLVNPNNRALFAYGADGLHEVAALRLAEHAIELSGADIFGRQRAPERAQTRLL